MSFLYISRLIPLFHSSVYFRDSSQLISLFCMPFLLFICFLPTYCFQSLMPSRLFSLTFLDYCFLFSQPAIPSTPFLFSFLPTYYFQSLMPSRLLSLAFLDYCFLFSQTSMPSTPFLFIFLQVLLSFLKIVHALSPSN